MTETQKAYLAGILDTRGYMGIKKTSNGPIRTPDYAPAVSIGSVRKEIVDLFYEEFGGCILHKSKGFVWEVTNKSAANVIRTLYSYLVLKKETAKRCLEIDGLKGTSNPWIIEAKERLYQI